LAWPIVKHTTIMPYKYLELLNVDLEIHS
jgi:hypothetical protein